MTTATLTPEQQAKNADRAQRGNKALEAYRDGDEQYMRDLLADLMHYAATTGLDFEYELGAAQRFYAAERNGDD